MKTSRLLRYRALVVSLGLLLGGSSAALADPPAGTEAGASASDTPKTLPQGSLFLSAQQSFKENPAVLAVRGHFELGSPPNVRRYYCLLNTKTGIRETFAVLGELVPRADGTTGIKNIAVSQYACADAQQQEMLVTTGYGLSEPAYEAPAPARRAPTSAASPRPAPAIATPATLAAETPDWAARAAIWEKDFNADDLKGVVALYAANGCRMPPHASTAQGNEAILASMKLAKQQGVASIRITVAQADSSGDLSYATGSFEVSSPDGKPLDHGKWMGVAKKLNGKWLTQCDIWNSDLPMPSNKAP